MSRIDQIINALLTDEVEALKHIELCWAFEHEGQTWVRLTFWVNAGEAKVTSNRIMFQRDFVLSEAQQWLEKAEVIVCDYDFCFHYGGGLYTDRKRGSHVIAASLIPVALRDRAVIRHRWSYCNPRVRAPFEKLGFLHHTTRERISEACEILQREGRESPIILEPEAIRTPTQNSR